MKALTFIILVFIIQQLDGNVIGPKILGDSIGISAFWILFAILVAGKFLGNSWNDNRSSVICNSILSNKRRC